MERNIRTECFRAELAAHYDNTIYTPVFLDYYGNSEFSNFGYWREDIKSQKDACEALMEELMQFVPGGTTGRALDVACGKGGTTQHLSRHFNPADVLGINISLRQLHTARTALPHCSFIMMDAAQLALKSGSFDVLFCVEAAFHFMTREIFFKEAFRVLRPGGLLVLSDILMNEEAEMRLPYHSADNFVRDPVAYRDILARNGFVDVQVVDATRESWHGCYWNIVNKAHKNLLEGRIDYATAERYLAKTYRMVTEIEYYVLAVGRRT